MPEEHTFDAVIGRLEERLGAVPPGLAHRRTFIATYLRTTRAVGRAAADAFFEDPGWVERWDVAFADFFLDAHDADLADRSRAAGSAESGVSRPWRLAFGAPEELPALRHLLLGINAHVNYDLPQAMLAVIDDAAFDDPALLARRERDHARIDAILASRVAAEDGELGGARTLLDRVLTPINRLSSQRFLSEARRKVWHNVRQLQRARLAGPAAYAARLRELDVLSSAKIADLLAPGQVLLRLGVSGFGVVLPPP